MKLPLLISTLLLLGAVLSPFSSLAAFLLGAISLVAVLGPRAYRTYSYAHLKKTFAGEAETTPTMTLRLWMPNDTMLDLACVFSPASILLFPSPLSLFPLADDSLGDPDPYSASADVPALLNPLILHLLISVSLLTLSRMHKAQLATKTRINELVFQEYQEKFVFKRVAQSLWTKSSSVGCQGDDELVDEDDTSHLHSFYTPAPPRAKGHHNT